MAVRSLLAVKSKVIVAIIGHEVYKAAESLKVCEGKLIGYVPAVRTLGDLNAWSKVDL